MDYGLLDVLELLGGLGVFIFGMKIMSEGIQKIAGKGLRKLLSYVTDNRFIGALTGFLITALIQSSSATTVMVVSFVNAGLLTLVQSVGVIMGANIGTTITGWLVATLGFKVKIASFALPIIGLAIPFLFSSNRKWKSISESAIGFGLLFLGLSFMKEAVPDLKNNPEVLSFLANFSEHGILSNILFVIIGTVLTIVVQSSSAAMSITLIMVAQGWVPFPVAASMILGENIGTTITAYLASLVGNLNSKRAARAHFVFNVFGVVWVLILLEPFLRGVDYVNMNFLGGDTSVFSGDETSRGKVMPVALSLFHTCFNIINTFLLIWFVPQIVKLAEKMVQGDKSKSELKLIGSNIIETPEIAILEAKNEIVKLGNLTQKMFHQFMMLYQERTNKREKLFNRIKKNEDKTDEMELEISNFLIEVSQSNTSEETSNRIVSMLSMVNDLERVGDICYQLSLTLERKEELDIKFKSKMETGIDGLVKLVDKSLSLMNSNLKAHKADVTIDEAMELESEINTYRDMLKREHLKRLEKKEDMVQSGMVFRDFYASLEKLADHVYNVNEAVVGIK